MLFGFPVFLSKLRGSRRSDYYDNYEDFVLSAKFYRIFITVKKHVIAAALC
jgi:hypothetical protein